MMISTMMGIRGIAVEDMPQGVIVLIDPAYAIDVDLAKGTVKYDPRAIKVFGVGNRDVPGDKGDE